MMAKTLIFCADGTWNGPGQDDDNDGSPNFTNIYKLFIGLEGELSPETIRNADEQEKFLKEGAKQVQVAKYIHGVGDSRNPIRKIMGGAFGAGTIARIVRGYTFISRNYAAGDAIVLTGFSRGAYTARALAGLIASEGLLAKTLTKDKELAYRWGAKAWCRYRSKAKGARKPRFLKRFAEAMADLPAFLSANDLKDEDLVPVEAIKSVAVWDTVGALGLPTYEEDSRVDAFRFADNRLSNKVEWGFHAVSLDEQRVDFVPTMWANRKNVEQMLFPGAHADVGGGYTTEGGESGLSNGALQWMVERLKGVGVQISDSNAASNKADAGGVANKPWRHKPFDLKGKAHPRDFSGSIVQEHSSIAQRMALPSVVAEPGEPPSKYEPTNRP
jgi:uncharacterized protein (DUF2235 family)